MAISINFRLNNNVVRSENANRYQCELRKQKPINDDELRELIIAAQNGNKKAREQAINANLSIVWSIAAHYNGMDVFEDILQNGNIGLINAVDTFDVSRETKFSTWALEMVRKYINIGLTDESRTVRMSAHLIGNEYQTNSFDAPLSNGEGEQKTLHDIMPSDTSADQFSKREAQIAKINYLMKGLSNTEKEIVCGLFGFGCREQTQYELSIKFNLTEERIRQIKWQAIEKMKEIAR